MEIVSKDLTSEGPTKLLKRSTVTENIRNIGGGSFGRILEIQKRREIPKKIIGNPKVSI